MSWKTRLRKQYKHQGSPVPEDHILESPVWIGVESRTLAALTFLSFSFVAIPGEIGILRICCAKAIARSRGLSFFAEIRGILSRLWSRDVILVTISNRKGISFPGLLCFDILWSGSFRENKAEQSRKESKKLTERTDNTELKLRKSCYSSLIWWGGTWSWAYHTRNQPIFFLSFWAQRLGISLMTLFNSGDSNSLLLLRVFSGHNSGKNSPIVAVSR